MTNGISKLVTLARGGLGHRRLPLALALAAVVLMLPALHTGLLLDDLVQRVMQFPPGELPPRLMDTGFVPKDSGQLGTVLCNLFGFPRAQEAAARARDYGILAWWVPDGLKAALWRPLTAFTHWLDYRLYPNAPVLMHAHNIAWYALAVYLAATLYRKLETCSPGTNLEERSSDPSTRPKTQSSFSVAGLAATLFLLDKNTYFPVMFVANRGFIIALVFGLLCLDAHHRWRTTRSRRHLWRSTLWLLLSLLANEGGASTLAFLAAYALVLEPGDWRSRLRSLLPSLAVILVWRIVYVSFGFGVRMIGGYIDPGYEPLLFLQNLPSRVNTLLGGQLTGLPPEIIVPLNAEWQTGFTLFFAGFNLLCAVAFLPILRRDRVTRFWAVAALLALVPAATVAPLSKNMAFVAVGAFGAVASFLAHFGRKAILGPRQGIAWCLAVWLVVAHIPGALAGRIVMAEANPLIPKVIARWCGFENLPEIGEKDVLVINNPSQLSTLAAPFYRAYHGQPLPKTMRILVPGSIRVEVRRVDESTLVLKTSQADLFDCPAVGPIHVCYVFKMANDFLGGGKIWKPGDRITREGFAVEVLEVSQRGMPSAVTFHFDRPLESEGRVWLFFDWRSNHYAPLVLPRSGNTIEIEGADYRR
jgi:hypothetical protein